MKKLLVVLSCLTTLSLTAQQTWENALSKALPTKIGSHQFAVSKVFTDKAGITHVYGKQTFNGKEIFNTDASYHFNAKQELAYKNENFVSFQVTNADFILTASGTAKLAAESKGLTFGSTQNKTEVNQQGKIILKNQQTSTQDLMVKDGYYAINQTLVPCWQVELYADASNDWYCMYYNASNGEKITESSYTAHCNLEEISGLSNVHTFAFEDEVEINLGKKSSGEPSYHALSLPLESPAKGNRSVLSLVANATASPYGWHDTDGVAGAEYTVTRGNNVLAKEDTAARNQITGYSPQSDSLFSFNFPYDIDARPNENLDAAITNLFVWNNYLHDIMFLYGFDEEAGNFQIKNYSNKGLGNDPVHAEAQDGSGTSNANFATPADGNNPRMQMYLWPTTTSTRLLKVLYPSTLANDYTSPASVFGPKLGTSIIEGQMALYKDTNATTSFGCLNAANPDELNGKIVLISRGGTSCSFTQKVKNAQKYGAIAAVVYNNTSSSPFSMTGTDNTITIPSFMISQSNGNSFVSALNNDSIHARLSDPSSTARIYDSDFDNGVIAHEYGHGISNRLTGGALNSNCLTNQEQAGEGWSDFFALVLTTRKWEKSNTTQRGIGTFLINQDTNGLGIRPYRYSKSMTVNPVTYNSIKTLSVPHGVGFVFCSALYDIMWDLIDKYGFSEDIYNGNGGNNKALQLVINGLKLQKCQPGFMDSRDAIILADSLYNGGANRELLWKAFARRGMGYSANQGLSSSRSDGTEAFDLPPDIISSGINLTSESNSLNVYPNPVSGNLNIELFGKEKINAVQIITLEGKTVLHTSTVNSNEVMLNVSDLTPGAYIIMAETAKGKLIEKFIKE